ncbi:hypothetical protein BSG1_15138 [Bacillus sp. SG-1]|nr:hypothetical protein BSG1_15138 [Bacillus sp. SG-1]
MKEQKCSYGSGDTLAAKKEEKWSYDFLKDPLIAKKTEKLPYVIPNSPTTTH